MLVQQILQALVRQLAVVRVQMRFPVGAGAAELLGGVAEQGTVAARVEDRVALHVPVPQAFLGRVQGQAQTFLAAFDPATDQQLFALVLEQGGK
ncbi:hypothetical protein D3C84_1061920 [compost metagenome]